MKTMLKSLLVFGIALVFSLAFFAQEAAAYHYNTGWNHYGNSYGPIHYGGHYSYSYSYGWSGWDYNRVRYSYHYPYRYHNYGYYTPYAYHHPGSIINNYGWYNGYGRAYTWYPWPSRYW